MSGRIWRIKFWKNRVRRATSCCLIALLGFAAHLVPAGPVAAEDKAPVKPYIWPLTYKGCLTSSFAEYRRNHFHAGIDLATGGKTGFKVRAIAAGEVYRLKTSPYGYGKVIYLKLEDGTIAVFAHLSDFVPEIRAAVEREQLKQDRYTIDLRLEPGSIPVQAGEIIGYSGQSGVGAPHLHFELRAGEERPINPILNGFPIQDAVPPEIRSVVLTPLEGTALVNGSVRPTSINFHWSEKDQAYRVESPVTIEGSVGIMMQTYDKQTACDRLLGVYRLDLIVDEQVSYMAQFDEFSYDVAHLVGLEFDQESIEKGGSRYHRLFTTESNLLPFTITDRRNAGVLFADGEEGSTDSRLLDDGVHEIVMIAGDASGNESKGVVNVVAGAIPEIRRAQVVDDSEVTAFIDGSPGEIGGVTISRSLTGARRWDERPATYSAERDGWIASGFQSTQAMRKPLIFKVEATTPEGAPIPPIFVFRNYDGIEAPEPVMDLSIEYHAGAALIVLDLDRAFPYEVTGRVVRSDRSVLRPEMKHVSPRRYEAIVQLSDLDSELAWVEVSVQGRRGAEWSAVEEIRALRVAGRRGGEVEDREGRARLKVPRTALLRDSYFRIEEIDGPPLEEGLAYMSPVYRYEPTGALLQEDVEVGIKPFMDHDDRKKVSIYRLDVHNRWNYMSRPQQEEGGTIWARSRILSRYALIRDDSAPSIYGLRPAEGAVVGTKTPRLQAKVTDIGSGFGPEDVQITLDDKKVIAEWDPERDLIMFNVRKPLTAGSHTLTVSAFDRAGNSVHKEATFFVSGN